MKGEKLRRFRKRHGEHVRNGFPVPSNIGDSRRIARSRAVLADDARIRHKVHLELHAPGPRTGFATPALRIEGKKSRRVSSHSRFGESGENLPNNIESSDVGRRRRT